MKIKEKNKSERGITLIALVVTIIILLILAGIAIASVTGDNGLFRKADESSKISDIAETKEQIKMELTTAIIDKTGEYNNQDVIKAVKKVTNKDVTEKTPTVESKKGNSVDISDLWVSSYETLKFSVNGSMPERYTEFKIESGTTWRQFFDNGSLERIVQLEDELLGFSVVGMTVGEAYENISVIARLLYNEAPDYDWRNPSVILRETIADKVLWSSSPTHLEVFLNWGDEAHGMDDIINTNVVYHWNVYFT